MTQQVYQRKVTMISYKEEIKWIGCFLTNEACEDFIARKQKDGFLHSVTSCGMGVMPLGEWIERFSMKETMDSLQEWVGDYQFSGRD